MISSAPTAMRKELITGGIVVDPNVKYITDTAAAFVSIIILLGIVYLVIKALRRK